MSTDTPKPESMPSDSEIFRAAMAPEPAPAEAPPVEQAPAPAEGERPRDELGRFLPTQPQEQQPPASPTPVAAPPPADEAGPPSGRFREMREERDAAQQRARELEFALYDMNRRLTALQTMQEQQQPKEQPAIPDVITDPAAYHQHVEKTFNERLRNMEANFSFRLAHQTHGEGFEQAYGEMIGRAQRGDPSVVQWVMRSPDPGAAMMGWFRQEKTLAQLNGLDPSQWFDHQFDERLKSDQKFAGWAMEKLRAHASAPGANGGNGQAQSGGPVNLPPSLQRLPASAPPNATGDMSDTSLFDVAFRQGRDRR